ncbi:hypothetical protein B0H16DRAFT_1456071 [Mycena metata]|uniref:Uncharacterized protein n=1 Tax=Mycena metata TaxID=1033252 RepID=A0AAD7JFD6_9AGAR|nr:hypothetical protein B0H16DRAFT_1456071 [Mycena metata]
MPGFTGCIYPGVSKEKQERIWQERRDRRRARADVSEMDVDEEKEEPVTVDMAAGWQGDLGVEEGWVNVEESAVEEGIEEDIEGQQQEVSEVMYELARMSVNGRTVEGDLDGNQEERRADSISLVVVSAGGGEAAWILGQRFGGRADVGDRNGRAGRGGAGRRAMALWVIRGRPFMHDLMVNSSWILEHAPPRRADIGDRNGRAGRHGAARDGALGDPGSSIYARFNGYFLADVGDCDGRAGRGGTARDGALGSLGCIHLCPAAASGMMGGGDDPDDASDGGTVKSRKRNIRSWSQSFEALLCLKIQENLKRKKRTGPIRKVVSKVKPKATVPPRSVAHFTLSFSDTAPRASSGLRITPEFHPSEYVNCGLVSGASNRAAAPKLEIGDAPYII